MGYGSKYYLLRGEAGMRQRRAAQLMRGDPGLSLKGIVKGIGGVVKTVSKIPVVGGLVTKIAPKFIPGIGLATTALGALGIAKKVGGAIGGGFAQMTARGGGGGMAAAGGMTAGKAALAGGAGGAAIGAGAGGGFAQMYDALRAAGESPASARAQARAATGGRRYRRMNVCNARALRRSMRRVQGFAKMARQTIQFTSRVKMKKGRRRAA